MIDFVTYNFQEYPNDEAYRNVMICLFCSLKNTNLCQDNHSNLLSIFNECRRSGVRINVDSNNISSMCGHASNFNPVNAISNLVGRMSQFSLFYDTSKSARELARVKQNTESYLQELEQERLQRGNNYNKHPQARCLQPRLRVGNCR